MAGGVRNAAVGARQLQLLCGSLSHVSEIVELCFLRVRYLWLIDDRVPLVAP